MPTNHSPPSMLFPIESSSIILIHSDSHHVSVLLTALSFKTLGSENQPGSDYIFSSLSRFFLCPLTVITSTRFSQ
uniref:Uncharacterized protein n=1 Tax=Populus trichocarpa TaxID=3694 RepID=A0A2K2BA14_POPTR